MKHIKVLFIPLIHIHKRRTTQRNRRKLCHTTQTPYLILSFTLVIPQHSHTFEN